jgi:hypothetical protein
MDGFGRQLNPQIDVMWEAKTYLPFILQAAGSRLPFAPSTLPQLPVPRGAVNMYNAFTSDMGPVPSIFLKMQRPFSSDIATVD